MRETVHIIYNQLDISTSKIVFVGLRMIMTNTAFVQREISARFLRLLPNLSKLVAVNQRAEKIIFTIWPKHWILRANWEGGTLFRMFIYIILVCL